MLENLKSECNVIDISPYKRNNYSELIPKSIFPDTEEEWENAFELENELESQEGMDDMPEPIFNALLESCLSKKKYRNALLLVCHANWGMRHSDVSQIKLIQLINTDGNFRTRISWGEQKTSKVRQFYINEAIQLALVLYLRNADKKLNDYLFVSESNNKGYEKETYINEKGEKRCVRINGKLVYKLNSKGEKIVEPLKRSQEENLIKDTLVEELGVALKNDSRCQGGELKLNGHSLRKLYAEKFNEVAYEMKRNDELKMDANIQTLVQWDLMHTSAATTARYCRGFEKVKEAVCNRMNIGLSVLERYL